MRIPSTVSLVNKTIASSLTHGGFPLSECIVPYKEPQQSIHLWSNLVQRIPESTQLPVARVGQGVHNTSTPYRNKTI